MMIKSEQSEQSEQVRRTTAATEVIESRLASLKDLRAPGPRELSQHLYDCLVLDSWPRTSAVVDWGIDTSSHLGALQHAIRAGATVADLDAACGSGPKLNALISRYNCGRYPDIIFATVYDDWGTTEDKPASI